MPIDVVNCGGFYIYKTPALQPRCFSRICLEKQMQRKVCAFGKLVLVFLNFIQVAPVRITKLFFNGVLKAEAYSKPSKYLGWWFFLGIVNNEKPLTIFGKKPHRRCSTSNIETIPLNCYANSLFIM